jgi:hypothetical protein
MASLSLTQNAGDGGAAMAWRAWPAWTTPA